MKVEAMFDEVAAQLLAEHWLEQGRMLRSHGLRTGGKFFAMVVEGDLVVKLPASRVEELVGGGEGRPFESGRRVMREWVRLQPLDRAACSAYVVEARSYVGAPAAR
jgi:hypothetical protein